MTKKNKVKGNTARYVSVNAELYRFCQKSNRVVSFYFPEFHPPALFEKVREKR
jgi:hypothetical protein